MEGNDYPDNNYDDVCDAKRVHTVINPHVGDLLNSLPLYCQEYFCQFLDVSFGPGSLQDDYSSSIYFFHTE